MKIAYLHAIRVRHYLNQIRIFSKYHFLNRGYLWHKFRGLRGKNSKLKWPL